MLNTLKLLGAKTLAVSLLTLPLAAQAADLVIDNQTFYASTSKINNQKGNAECSDNIQDYGITAAQSKNSIPKGIIWAACLANLHNCTADVYMTNNCTGPVIATVVFDVNKGIKSITNFYGSEGFIIANPPRDPFYVEIMGGPAAAVTG